MIYKLNQITNKHYFMKSRSLFLSLLLGVIILGSCVSSKKYKSAVAEAEQLKSQNAELNTQISNYQKQVSDLNASTKNLNDQYAKYKSDCEVLQKRFAAQQAALKEEVNTMEKVADR